MEVKTDIGHQITARKLMHIMLYDNGAVIYCEPDGPNRYPKKIFDDITKACEIFFDAHPKFLTDEDLDNIAAGEETENQEKYGIYPEYEHLNNLLNDYFEIM
jgi:hypothetical protein